MDIQVEESRIATPMPKVLDGLNDLLKLDHDALGAYEIAVEKLENPDWADQITGFMRDHERHIRDLNELIVELGGTPTNEPHATGPFKQALQSLGGLAGDRGVLVAFRANELQVRMKYDRYASRANRWPRNAKEVVDRNALDEERHYQWAADVLEELGIPATGGAEIGAATRLREGMNRLHDSVDVDEIRSDLEARTRDQPMRMALAAFAAGFVIGRILR